jgi:CHAD domain-containing protein
MTGEKATDLASALDGHWDDYRARFKAGRREISEETVHDLRVSSRRFLALLDIVGGLDPHPRVKKMRRFLKQQLSQLDQLHDAQVMLMETGQRLEQLPELGPFEAYLQKCSKRLARAALKDLRASKPSDLKKQVSNIRNVVEEHAQESGFPARVLRPADRAYSKTVRALRKVRARQPDTIHHTRVAFKKFRYMVETVRPFLPTYPEANFERMHDYQDAMGKVHDAVVFLDTLSEFEKSAPKSSRQKPLTFNSRPIRMYYKKHLSELIHNFLNQRTVLRTFWRAGPGRTFPWEKSDDSLHNPTRDRRASGQRQQRTTRQPAGTDRRGAQEDAPDRTGSGGAGRPNGSHSHESLHPGR